jgi:drug/metabolite transporter (DMT)-like permease
LGAIAFLGESMTLRLVLASAAILAGIALVILKKKKASGQRISSADAATRWD